MAKKIIFLLILLLATEAVVLGSTAAAFQPWQPDTKPSALAPRLAAPTGNLILPQTLKLQFQNRSWILTPKDLAAFNPQLTRSEPGEPTSWAAYFFKQTGAENPWTEDNFFDTVTTLAVNEQTFGLYLQNLAKLINRPPQNAEFLVENGRVTKFAPDLPGLSLSLAQTRDRLKDALLTNTPALALPIVATAPAIKLAALNTLGIKELLARGQSDFSGSSAARIQNIRVGASQFQGALIKPGEEFSFNSRLGPIDAAHGYLPELVIKPEGTVPEFGGGLCQVATTAFRAAFFAGLPITKRRNHSYAVRYYEWISDDVPRAVGLDATIYPGAQDLKFVNDTPGAILVWTRMEDRKLYFDFYGTKDNRQVIVDGPHPYDQKPNGAVKSTVARTVIYPDGENKAVTFNSNYVSPNLYPKIYEYPKVPPTSTTAPAEIPSPNQTTN